MDPADDEDDVQIVKVVKKPLTWVSSSFDDFSFESVKSQQFTTPKTNFKTSQQNNGGTSADLNPLKQHREHPNQPIRSGNSQDDKTIRSAINSDLWLEKHKPLSRSDLAVHKKKIEAIIDWLTQSSQFIIKRKAPILVLSGPPGAGKTACVHVLCAELGLNVQEWSSSSEHAVDQWTDLDFTSGEKSKVDVYMSQSQNSNFHNFLLRANKYHALDLFGSNKNSNKQTTSVVGSHNRDQRSVIVVEDIPNIFFRDTRQFHDILRKYHFCGHSPLVFILSESNNNSCSNLKLFPKDLQIQLKITNISLNPIAPTVLVKLLTGIVNKEARLGKFRVPSPSVIETVAVSSSGDIRLAINTLQFACRSDTTNLKALFPKSSEKKKSKQKNSLTRLKKESGSKNKDNSLLEDSQLLLGAKDTSVFLFHAVGKILYFKRGNSNDYPSYQRLPSHLKEHERDPLLCDPENVIHKSHLSGDYFNSFLHENYVDFISSVEDLERASNYFSDADYLSSPWAAREQLQNYSSSVATRGYIHSNSELCKFDDTRRTGWRPLNKSQLFGVNKQADENITTAKQLFKGYHWERVVLCTDILPYISLTNPTLHDAGQISFVQEMAQFSHNKPVLRSQHERLDEKDVIVNDEDDGDNLTKAGTDVSSGNANCWDDNMMEQNVSNSQTKIQELNCANDEVVIEDYDDEF